MGVRLLTIKRVHANGLHVQELPSLRGLDRDPSPRTRTGHRASGLAVDGSRIYWTDLVAGGVMLVVINSTWPLTTSHPVGLLQGPLRSRVAELVPQA
jgi:hypothetical protein